MLVSEFGWRSIFFVNLPLGALGIWLAACHVKETPRSARGFDLAGQILGIATLFGLSAAVIEAGAAGWLSPIVLAAAALAAVGGACFAWVEMRARQPMLPVSLFKQRSFDAAVLVGFLINFALYGVIFVLGLFLQQVLHYSPWLSGLAFLPFPVVLALSNIASGRIAGRLGQRLPMVAGLLIGALGYLLLVRIGRTTPYLAILPGLVIIPLGIGLAVPAMTSTLLGAAPRERTGIASGVLNMVRQAGGALGVALFGTFLAADPVAGLQRSVVVSAVLLAAGAGVAVLGLERARKSRGPQTERP
jgi:DHA2 family methylenomycin A resistance protein-like MFS transporter